MHVVNNILISTFLDFIWPWYYDETHSRSSLCSSAFMLLVAGLILELIFVVDNFCFSF